MLNGLRVGIVLILIFLMTVLLAPFQIVFILTRSRFSRLLPVIWHKIALWLIGVRVRYHGKLPANRPLMVVSNHISWSDILILGSVMPVCFIAKDEVKTWPGISQLARLQRSVFVNREKRTETAIQADSIAARLVEGDAMVLFAEGSTGDGIRMLPFKSALFGACERAMGRAHFNEVTVVPVALAYTKLHGLPLGRYHQTRASWPGDMELAPHLKQFLLSGSYDVDVVVGEPVTYHASDSRKVISRKVENRVRQLFSLAMRGKRIEIEDTDDLPETGHTRNKAGIAA